MNYPQSPQHKLTPSQITSNQLNQRKLNQSKLNQQKLNQQKLNQSKLNQHRLSQSKIAAPKAVRSKSPRQVVQTGFPVVFYLAFCFVGMLIGLGFAGRLSYLVLGLYLVQNLLTYALYVDDKNAAINGQQRIPEYNLHVMSLIGGWPAAALAQQQHRHKTQKQPFKAIYWLTALVHSVVFMVIVIGF